VLIEHFSLAVMAEAILSRKSRTVFLRQLSVLL